MVLNVSRSPLKRNPSLSTRVPTGRRRSIFRFSPEHQSGLPKQPTQPRNSSSTKLLETLEFSPERTCRQRSSTSRTNLAILRQRSASSQKKQVIIAAVQLLPLRLGSLSVWNLCSQLRENCDDKARPFWIKTARRQRERGSPCASETSGGNDSPSSRVNHSESIISVLKKEIEYPRFLYRGRRKPTASNAIKQNWQVQRESHAIVEGITIT